MNVTEKELKQLSEMLSRYEREHGAVAEYSHKPTNCYGSCSGYCAGGCGGTCKNSCYGYCRGAGN